MTRKLDDVSLCRAHRAGYLQPRFWWMVIKLLGWRMVETRVIILGMRVQSIMRHFTHELT
jgi:hypothetical protein